MSICWYKLDLTANYSLSSRPTNKAAADDNSVPLVTAKMGETYSEHHVLFASLSRDLQRRRYNHEGADIPVRG